MNTFTSASGNTVVPMSRPSITTPRLRPMRCCWATMAWRTMGMTDTSLTELEIRIWRMSSSRLAPFRHSSLRPVRRLRRKLMCMLVQGLLDAGQVVEGDAVLQQVQRYGPVHGAGVDVGVVQGGGYGLGGGAFSARRVTINGDNELFHNDAGGHWPRKITKSNPYARRAGSSSAAGPRQKRPLPTRFLPHSVAHRPNGRG